MQGTPAPTWLPIRPLGGCGFVAQHQAVDCCIHVGVKASSQFRAGRIYVWTVIRPCGHMGERTYQVLGWYLFQWLAAISAIRHNKGLHVALYQVSETGLALCRHGFGHGIFGSQD